MSIMDIRNEIRLLTGQGSDPNMTRSERETLDKIKNILEPLSREVTGLIRQIAELNGRVETLEKNQIA